MLLVVVIAVLLIGNKISEIGNDMSVNNTREISRYRQRMIVNEFYKTRELLRTVAAFARKQKACREDDLLPLLGTLRQVDPKLSRLWMLVPEKDSLFVVGRDDVVMRIAPEQEAGMQVVFARDSMQEEHYSGVFLTDTLRSWTIIERVSLASGESLFLGGDVFLTDLHAYFAEGKEPVNSYVFILNEDGILLSHPDETLLGRRLMESSRLDSLRTVLNTSQEMDVIDYSSFLSCPVYRTYYPVQLENERWIVAVSVPLFMNQEILSDFHRYTLLITLLTVLVFSVLLFYAQRKWRKENRLRLKVEQESMELHLQQLKNQINPHFLFNSLNSLSVLIGTEPAMAKDFVLKLSRVYRYLLEKRNTTLAAVRDELEFTRQYYFLQQVRFGEQLVLNVEVEASYLNEKIPAMGLQTLVENAIKHNLITKQSPLVIDIYTGENCLVVRNNYQPREDGAEDSMGVGLERIAKIYEYYSVGRFEYGCQDGFFFCRLPFL